MSTRTVLCFGDSNTHGTIPIRQLGVSLRHPFADRWPNVMAQALGEGWHVISEGHGGRTSEHDEAQFGSRRNGSTVFLSLLESHRPLDLVIIMLGTNDLKAEFGVDAATIAVSVERLVAIARSSACGLGGNAPDVLVVTPTPIIECGELGQMFSGGAAKSLNLAQAFEAMGQRARVRVFDAGEVCEVSPTDGVHFETQALHALGRALARQVKQMIN